MAKYKKRKLRKSSKVVLVILACVILSGASIALSLYVSNRNNKHEVTQEKINYEDYFYDKVIMG